MTLTKRRKDSQMQSKQYQTSQMTHFHTRQEWTLEADGTFEAQQQCKVTVQGSFRKNKFPAFHKAFFLICWFN